MVLLRRQPRIAPGRKAVLAALIGLAAVSYPLLVYLGIAHGGWRPLSLILLLLLALRLFLPFGDRSSRRMGWTSAIAALGFPGAALLSGTPDFLLYYPVAVNTGMLIIFGLSLFRPPPIIERLARLREPDLSPAGVAWTRKVTKVWCLFFVTNGAIALYTVLSDDLELWALYNGLISYIAIGCLLGGEYLARRLMMRRVPA